MVADLFVNFSIGISLIFIYMQMRWKSHRKSVNPGLSVLIDGLSGGFMGFLLMYFSIPITAETILDFRYVPIMLMVLFVGKWPAVISSLIIIVSRFYIGMNRSAMYAILMVSILLIGYLILNELFKKEERMLRRGLYLTVYSNSVMTFFLVFLVGDSNIASLLLIIWITSTIGGVASVYLVNYIRNSEYLFNKYQVESSTDFLTGLSNFRQFEDYWNKTAAEARAYQESCAILMLDIDHFKSTNDTYGHAAGDYILVELGRIMEETIRNKGSAFRKGGEEFVIVLPKSHKAEALEIAETLRAKVEKNDFSTNERVIIPITVSIGVSIYPETINQLSDMIETADALLYKSKNSGRNRVSV
ncbi:diguanylate cyclase [Alkalibacterium sp. f15]|uniref:diguanylate cyclase n=1 Tax=Alkalibacterium sp. f15 TaxID=3414029 RepID=UPI003BF86215